MEDSGSEAEYHSAEEGERPSGRQREGTNTTAAERSVGRDKNHPTLSQSTSGHTNVSSTSPEATAFRADSTQAAGESLEQQAGTEEPVGESDVVKEDREGLSTVGEPSTVDCATGLDNRYVSEDVTVKGSQVELTEEQMKELREQANKLKNDGNECFKGGEYAEAVQLYTKALELYPPLSDHEASVCFANRAACFMKMDEHQSVVDDCTKALELKPDYLKAVVRRAQANEALEKYEDALEDYKRALELDPSQAAARQAVLYLPDKVKEQQEKLKEEMLGKLKDLGNAILKPFGLSTNNFQLQQDPNSGGYSMNFKR